MKQILVISAVILAAVGMTACGSGEQEPSASSSAEASTGTDTAEATSAGNDETPTFDSAYALGTQTQCRYLVKKAPDEHALDMAECGIKGTHYDISIFATNDDRDQYLENAGPIADAFGMEYDMLVGDRFMVSPSDTSDIAKADYSTFEDVFGGEIQHIG